MACFSPWRPTIARGFDKPLTWTQNNLAEGDLETTFAGLAVGQKGR